jgi:hypothetical protein
LGIALRPRVSPRPAFLTIVQSGARPEQERAGPDPPSQSGPSCAKGKEKERYSTPVEDDKGKDSDNGNNDNDNNNNNNDHGTMSEYDYTTGSQRGYEERMEWAKEMKVSLITFHILMLIPHCLG